MSSPAARPCPTQNPGEKGLCLTPTGAGGAGAEPFPHLTALTPASTPHRAPALTGQPLSRPDRARPGRAGPVPTARCRGSTGSPFGTSAGAVEPAPVPGRRAGPSADQERGRGRCGCVTKPPGFVTTCGRCPMSAAARRHVPAFI